MNHLNKKQKEIIAQTVKALEIKKQQTPNLEEYIKTLMEINDCYLYLTAREIEQVRTIVKGL